MHSGSNPPAGDRAAAQQRFLSLFLRSEREIFRYVAALVPKVPDAEDKEKNVPHIWHVDGNAHDSTEWRNNLDLFSQKLFR